MIELSKTIISWDIATTKRVRHLVGSKTSGLLDCDTQKLQYGLNDFFGRG
jgi:hypothetical protein